MSRIGNLREPQDGKFKRQVFESFEMNLQNKPGSTISILANSLKLWTNGVRNSFLFSTWIQDFERQELVPVYIPIGMSVYNNYTTWERLVMWPDEAELWGAINKKPIIKRSKNLLGPYQKSEWLHNFIQKCYPKYIQQTSTEYVIPDTCFKYQNSNV
jgi:hypothetical protein